MANRKEYLKNWWKWKGQQYREAYKKVVYEHYGYVCNCCGETGKVFLCIDHVNNDGNIERKKYGNSGNGMYLKIIREEFPDSYQVLCHNCNQAKRILGKCPHNK